MLTGINKSSELIRSFASSYKSFWINGLDFKGKSKRYEFWSVIFLHAIILLIIEEVLQLKVLQDIYLICCVIPILSIEVRRLRDIGKNWKWIFINFIPFIGVFWLIYLMTKPSLSRD